jgi:hypothetical protein
MISKKYSFKKLTQFSQGNNVLKATGSTTDVFLWREILQLRLIDLFGKKEPFLP